MKTYRDTLQHLDPWSRGVCINEAMLTHFVAPVPEELAFLSGGLADLGFDNLDLPPQEQNKILLAFVGRGVRVPGTPYRLRNWGITSLIEAADGGEKATLPDGWRQALLVPTRDHDGFTWVGRRVPRNQIGDVGFRRYEAVADGWVPKGQGASPSPSPSA
jgi:hypothetical protein